MFTFYLTVDMVCSFRLRTTFWKLNFCTERIRQPFFQKNYTKTLRRLMMVCNRSIVLCICWLFFINATPCRNICSIANSIGAEGMAFFIVEFWSDRFQTVSTTDIGRSARSTVTLNTRKVLWTVRLRSLWLKLSALYARKYRKNGLNAVRERILLTFFIFLYF